MDKVAIFPGSFDPITKGHEDLIRRVLPLFDKVIVAIGVNAEKKYMFPLEKRMDWIRKTFRTEKNFEVKSYEGLTVNFCKEEGATYIIRGLRDSKDFEYEKSIAQMNHEMIPEIDSLFLVSKPEYSAYSSSIVRDIIRNNGNVSRFIPDSIQLSE